jgi:DNA-binding transcriptional LysR family regulator
MQDGILLDDLYAFVAVADAGSISAAAERLYLGQPVVSRRIQRLEQALGTAVLDRRVRPTAVTATGAAILPHCRQILAALGAIQLVATGEAPLTSLSLGVAPALAEDALAEATEVLCRHLPQATLRLTTQWTGTLLEELLRGGLDAAVIQLPEGSSPPAALQARALGTSRLCFVAPAQLRLPDVVELGELAELPWVLNGEGCGFRALLQRGFAVIERAPLVGAEVQGYALHTALIAQGVGLGLLPERIVRRAAQRRQLHVLHVPGHSYTLTIWSVRGPVPAVVETALDSFEARLIRSWT